MRTLDEALQRAEVLRAFRDTNSERFDRNQDFADIVILADEIVRLKSHKESDQIPCPTCGHEPLFYQYEDPR